MATWYVYNISTNETVNLRKTASSTGTILVRVGYGKAVEASASSYSGWHNASFGGYTGYIMSQYLTLTNPSGGGTVTPPTGTGTAGKINGNTVRVRSSTATTPTNNILATLNDGYDITYWPGTPYSGTDNSYTWYKCQSAAWTGTGYIASQLVRPAGSGGTTGSWVTRYINTPGETLKIRRTPVAVDDSNVNERWGHGTQVEVDAPSATWTQVRKPGQAVAGYCMTSFLVTSPPTFTGAPSSGTLYCGITNTTQVMCRKNLTGSTALGNFENNTPVGYRLTTDPAYVETYWGFNPTICGYSNASYITAQTKTKAQLLADIAKAYYDKSWNMSKFGMSGKWCQWFVNFCVVQAGLGVQNSGWTSNTNCTGGWGAMSSRATMTPSVGSIFYTKSGTDTVSHTGIVVSLLPGGSCMVVDGNYASSTNLTHRELNPNNMAAGVTLLGFVKASGT